MKEDLFKKGLKIIRTSQEKRERGLLNCIPNPFNRFSDIWSGIEKGKYTIVTANSKVGKTHFSDFMYMYYPMYYVLNINPKSNIKYKVYYFSLEMSAEQKILQAMSHFLYVFYGVSKHPKELRSLKRALDNDVINKLYNLEGFFTEFFNNVQYIEINRDADSIINKMKAVAKEKGDIEYGTYEKDSKEYQFVKNYNPNNPDEIILFIIDHISLIDEKGSLHSEISKLSKGSVYLRNTFKFNPLIIQQQAAAQESTENKKQNDVRPTLAGLADNKLTQRDADMVFGLFSPYRYNISNFKGYNINEFKDRIRFLEILADREGIGNEIAPLYFNGECSYFKELPTPGSEEIKTLNQI